jgi:hypothetical protein
MGAGAGGRDGWRYASSDGRGGFDPLTPHLKFMLLAGLAVPRFEGGGFDKQFHGFTCFAFKAWYRRMSGADFV